MKLKTLSKRATNWRAVLGSVSRVRFRASGRSATAEQLKQLGPVHIGTALGLGRYRPDQFRVVVESAIDGGAHIMAPEETCPPGMQGHVEVGAGVARGRATRPTPVGLRRGAPGGTKVRAPNVGY